jgi:hypothetical protein
MSSPSDHIAAKSFHAFVGGAGGMGGVPPVLWSPVLSTIYPATRAVSKIL